MPEIVLIDYYQENTKELIKAYREMAQLNLSIANMCIYADEQQLAVYEEKLAEGEEF